jgi:hypothetical protein
VVCLKPFNRVEWQAAFVHVNGIFGSHNTSPVSFHLFVSPERTNLC